LDSFSDGSMAQFPPRKGSRGVTKQDTNREKFNQHSPPLSGGIGDVPNWTRVPCDNKKTSQCVWDFGQYRHGGINEQF
jgi:hypothetical protein